jgi:hypothetical protein
MEMRLCFIPVFTTNTGIRRAGEFIKATGVATREWLRGTEEMAGEAAGEERDEGTAIEAERG